jgi:hypothetical protein
MYAWACLQVPGLLWVDYEEQIVRTYRELKAAMPGLVSEWVRPCLLADAKADFACGRCLGPGHGRTWGEWCTPTRRS